MDAPPRSQVILGGRYDLVEMIGFGGSAQVWRCFDRELHREVAVKILATHSSAEPSVFQRFRREARHVASLSHPNIVPVYDFGVADGRAFLIMEYIDGPSLQDLLSPALPVAPTARVALDVLYGLAHAHRRGIVHRDVKPANILLGRSGIAMVADFGVARGVGDTTELTAVGSFVGTAKYASPEQFSGAAIGPASDLYSVGCVLYRCLAGHAPFEADEVGQLVLQHRFADAVPVHEACPEIPPALEAVIERAMAKRPDDRFADAMAMRAAVEPFAASGLEDLFERWTVVRPPTSIRPSILIERITLPYRRSEATAIGDELPQAPSVATQRMASRADSRRGAIVALLVVLTLLAAGLSWWQVAGDHGRPKGAISALPSGGALQPNQSITSPNRRFELTMQSDGNLVEYLAASRSTRWETGTSGNFGAYAVVQADGDFVVYPKGKSAPPPGNPTPALWSSGTFGHPGSLVALQDDGVVVVRAAGNRAVLWASQ